MSEAHCLTRKGSKEGTKETSSLHSPTISTDTPPTRKQVLRRGANSSIELGCVHLQSSVISAPSPKSKRYDPRLMQNNAAQLVVPGPVVPEILQCPRTASSGRRLIVVNRGGSYCF
jgi:hypothetical protein